MLAVTPEAVIVGADADRLPGTVCIGVPGLNAETLVMAFDLEGFAISAGSACSSGKVRRSHVLTAMGLSDTLARAAVRISFGRDTTDEEIDALIDAWGRIVGRQRSGLASENASHASGTQKNARTEPVLAR